MQHTKTPIGTRIAALRTQRSIIVARLVADKRVQDDLSQYRNVLNQRDLDLVNKRISELRSRA